MLVETAGEGTVLATLISTRCLAIRIRRAYLRRRPWWTGADPEAAVWMASAVSLLDAHQMNPKLPLDPELFVVSQPQCSSLADPWGDLVGARAIKRYRNRVRWIVGKLRTELRSELRLIRSRVSLGHHVEWQVAHGGRGLSPLGRYIAAVRSGNETLADSLLNDALRQHEGCPLYRQACQGLLPENRYPTARVIPSILRPLPAGVVVGWN